MRILLIEDDPATAESLELMLRKADLNTYVTDSGEEGIELAKLYDYDLIILDLTLPDMDGYDVLRKLRLSKIETPRSSSRAARAPSTSSRASASAPTTT